MMSNKGLRKPLIIFLEPYGAHGGMIHLDDEFCSSLAERGLDVIWATCTETELIVSDHHLWTPFRGIYGDSSRLMRGLNYLWGLWLVLQKACREQITRPVIVHQQFITVLPIEWVFTFLLKICRVSRVISPHDTIPFNTRGRVMRLLPIYYHQFDAIISHNQKKCSLSSSRKRKSQ